MDHAIQKAVREAVKDFDHINDYYFLIFNNLTKNFDSSTSQHQQQHHQSSSGSIPPFVETETETKECSSDKKYLDYLLFDSGDGVIVRIERRSPSPSQLKIKNCNQIINDQTHKILNYDLNLKISSNYESDVEIVPSNSFETVKNLPPSTGTSELVPSSNTVQSSEGIATGIGNLTNTETIPSVIKKKFKKSSQLTDTNANSNTICNSYHNHNEPMRQLQNCNTLCMSSEPQWMTTMTGTIMNDTKNGKIDHDKVQHNHTVSGGASNNLNYCNSSNNNSLINGHHNGSVGSGVGTESDDDGIIFDSNLEKPWICRNCNRGYKWRNSLTCHQKNECGKPPKYYCTKLCGYRTNIRSNLRRHLNTKCSGKDKLNTTITASATTVQHATKQKSSQSYQPTSLISNSNHDQHQNQYHYFNKQTTKNHFILGDNDNGYSMFNEPLS